MGTKLSPSKIIRFSVLSFSNHQSQFWVKNEAVDNSLILRLSFLLE
ncbi:hypothetical protein T08_1835 [Trichinella sp. T8]|nr:hypothetical protein T08_1835 [Trichinella sp. T8]